MGAHRRRALRRRGGHDDGRGHRVVTCGIASPGKLRPWKPGRLQEAVIDGRGDSPTAGLAAGVVLQLGEIRLDTSPRTLECSVELKGVGGPMVRSTG